MTNETEIVYRCRGKRGKWVGVYKSLDDAKREYDSLKKLDKTTRIYKVTETWEVCDD